MSDYKPSHWMTMHGKVGDHPRGNYWFADLLAEDEPDYDARAPWAVFLQMAGVVSRLDIGFQSKESAEAFIRDDILGTGALIG